MRLYTHSYTEGLSRYRADPAACNACPLKPRCTPGDSGRVVRRSFEEGLIERVRSYHGTFPYEKALRKRGVWVEPLFGEAKEWHGMRRFRLRRLEKVARSQRGVFQQAACEREVQLLRSAEKRGSENVKHRAECPGERET